GMERPLGSGGERTPARHVAPQCVGDGPPHEVPSGSWFTVHCVLLTQLSSTQGLGVPMGTSLESALSRLVAVWAVTATKYTCESESPLTSYDSVPSEAGRGAPASSAAPYGMVAGRT